MTTARGVASLLFLVMLAGCAKDSTGPDPVDISGTWAGWLPVPAPLPDPPPGTNIIVNLTQSGTVITGTGSRSGVPLTLTGSFDAPDFSFTITISGGGTFTVTGAYSATSVPPATRYLVGPANGDGYTNAPMQLRKQ